MDKETKILLKNLQEIIDTIKDALDKDAIKAAFFCSLSIPDIGGQIEFPRLRKKEKGNVGERYKRWYNEWVFQYENPKVEDVLIFGGTPNMNKIDGNIMYLLRCKLYHQGDGASKEVQNNLISKYQKRYPDKNIELFYTFDTEYDKISSMVLENNVYIEINVNPKVLAEKLMWNAEAVIREYKK